MDSLVLIGAEDYSVFLNGEKVRSFKDKKEAFAWFYKEEFDGIKYWYETNYQVQEAEEGI